MGKSLENNIVLVRGLVGVLFLLFAVQLIAYAFYGSFWTDEKWYFAGSTMVAQGLHPIRDFFTHHNPLFFYVYALPQKIFGPDFIVGRLFSVVIMAAQFFLVYALVKKIENRTAALLALLLLTTNPFYLRYMSYVSYYPLQGLLVVSFFLAIASGVRPIIKYPFAALLLALLVLTRYLIDFVTVFSLCYILYLIFILKERTRVWVLSLSVIVGVILSYGTVFYYYDHDRFLASVSWVLLRTSYDAPLSAPDILSSLSLRVGILLSVVQNYFSIICLGAFIAIFYISNWKGSTLKNLFRMGPVLFLMILFIAGAELMYQIPIGSSAIVRAIIYPVMCAFAGIGLVRVIEHLDGESGKKAVIVLATILICFSALVQERPAMSKTWSNSYTNYINRVAKSIDDNTGPDAVIFSFEPHFVAEANRKLLFNSIMELYQVFPDMDETTCVRNGFLNIQMIENALSKRTPDALVIEYPGRLYDRKGMGRRLVPYRDELEKIIGDNYYIVDTVGLQVPKKDVYANIYLRKGQKNEHKIKRGDL